MRLGQRVRVHTEGSVILPLHDIFPDFVGINVCELNWHELVINGRERDAHCRRDDYVGSSSDELRIQMVQVVLETHLHDCFEWLLGENESILVVAI